MSEQVKVGHRVGRLTVTGIGPFTVVCDCGNIPTYLRPSHILQSRVKSCGCLRREQMEARALGPKARWSSVECLNPDAKVDYRRYRVTCRTCGEVCERGRPSVVHKSYIGCSSCLRLRRGKPSVDERRAALYPEGYNH